jgi:very-short-patch-repair endonuclease
MASDLPHPLRELAWHQRGIITAQQALAAGLTREAIHVRLEQGRWQWIHTGVFATFTGPPERPAVLWAAVLRAGPGAMLSHHSAAELHRLTDRQVSLIHVTVGGRRPRPIPGLRLHLSGRADQARHPALSPPCTRIEETVLDLAVSARSLDDAYGWVTRALARRLTTQTRLTEAMALRGKLRWRRELAEALTADSAGAHSLLEHRYLRDVERRHRLPPGVRQARVRRGGRTEYRDVLYEQYGIAVELDGQGAHEAERRWHDIQRDNAAAATGILTLRYSWLDVTSHPCEVAAQVAAALSLHGCDIPRPCSAGCPVRATVTARAGA